MSDPGLALRATTLPGALALVAPALGVPASALATADHADEAAAVEACVAGAGLRARRVLLDGRWWRESGPPLLARIADRRQSAREGDPASAGSTGWVALLPAGLSGYRMVAIASGDGTHATWRVDDATAARLAPFAYAFHRQLPPRALGAGDLVRFTLGHARADGALLAATGFAAALLGLLPPIATGRLLDRAIPQGEATMVMGIVAGLAAAGLAAIALDVLRAIASLRFEARTGVALQAAVLDRVIGAPARFFRQFSSGDLAVRVASVAQAQRGVTGIALGAFGSAVFAATNLALMAAWSLPLTVAASGVVAVAAACSAALGLARVRIGRRIEAADGKLAAMAFEYFGGIAKLRACAAEPRAFANWLDRYRDYRRLDGQAAGNVNLETVLLAVLQPAALALVLWLAWRLAATPGARTLSVGEFVAYQAALFGLLGGVQGLVGAALGAMALRPAWERARPILETAPEDAARGGVHHQPSGDIALANVSFAYPGGPEVLSGIDLAIRPGEFVALVGSSGSGKSTLVRLMLGFETPAAGEIRYDGLPLASLDLRALRGHVGTVLQAGRLWAGDILGNIVGATRLTVDDAWEAARAAGLAADIEAMPMGMYTLVGEGVSTLSGGQRQRVLIARALAGKPSILLLDEATSALDSVSQAAVLDSLERVAATRIVIAHRLATVRNADRIVVLERGRIVQEGTFRQLASAPGPFAQMLARQVA